MAVTNASKRAPIFTSVDQLRPDGSGHNLTVKVSAFSRYAQGRWVLAAVTSTAKYRWSTPRSCSTAPLVGTGLHLRWSRNALWATRLASLSLQPRMSKVHYSATVRMSSWSDRHLSMCVQWTGPNLAATLSCAMLRSTCSVVQCALL